VPMPIPESFSCSDPKSFDAQPATPRLSNTDGFARAYERDVAARAGVGERGQLRQRSRVAAPCPREGGIGKTHLAQAYGRECRVRGPETYHARANEPGDGSRRAAERGSAQRTVAKLVKPSCLIVDEVGRCVFDRACTDLLSDVIDRRYEKEGPNTMIPTSNVAPSSWDEFLAGTRPCSARSTGCSTRPPSS
jgi:hypothetical protein